MAFIPAADTARVEIIQAVLQQTTENVVYVMKPTGWTAEHLLDLAEAVATWWGNELAGSISNSVTLSTVRCTDVEEEDSFQVEFSPSADNVGLRASPILPLNVTLAVKFSTGLTGRSQRGRSYFIGLCEDQVTGNEIIAARRDEIVDAWAQFNSTIQATFAAAEHVIVSYVHDGAPRTAAQVLPVASYSADTFIDSQRRRLSGRGS